MKRLLTIAVAAASLTLIASSAKAQYVTGDLMMGFEAGGTKDVLFDLGPAQMFVTASAPFSISLGNLNTALISAFGASPGTNANVFTAIFGDANPNDPNNTLYANRPHANAGSGSTQSGIGSLMDQTSSEYNNEGASPAMIAIVQDITLTPNSYLSQVSGGKVFSNLITETQFSLGTLMIDRMPSTTNGGGAVRTLGTLTFGFDGSGNITSAMFSPVPEPSTYALGFVGAAVLVLFVRRRATARA